MKLVGAGILAWSGNVRARREFKRALPLIERVEARCLELVFPGAEMPSAAKVKAALACLLGEIQPALERADSGGRDWHERIRRAEGALSRAWGKRSGCIVFDSAPAASEGAGEPPGLAAALRPLVAAAEGHGFRSAVYHMERLRFLRSQFHRADADQDLSLPRWCETPDRVDEIVRDRIGLRARRGGLESLAEARTVSRIRYPLGSPGFAHWLRAGCAGPFLAFALLVTHRLARRSCRARAALRESRSRACGLMRLCIVALERSWHADGTVPPDIPLSALTPSQLNLLARAGMAPEWTEVRRVRLNAVV